MKLLVVVARGLQASLVGAYGNHWVSTPALDGLAARGVLFDACFADVATPAGVRRSWRTGRLDHTGRDLLALLRVAGVPALLVHDVSRPLPADFLDGWAATVEVDPAEDEDPLELALQGAAELLEAMRDETNALVWLDLPTALPPWNVPEEIAAPYFEDVFADDDAEDAPSDDEDEDEDEPADTAEDEELAAEMIDDEAPPDFLLAPPVDRLGPDDDHLYLSLRTSYAAAVAYLDLGVGQLLRTLDIIDPNKEFAIVFTGDLGLPLGEHGPIGWETAGPHEELLHVPLLVRLPGTAHAGRREAGLCQPIDLAVTLAALFGVRLPDAHGRNLLAADTSDPPYRIACVPHPDGEVWSLRTPEWSYVWRPPRDGADPVPGSLFQQPEDAWEVNDVRQHHLELAEHFEQLLRAAVAASRQPGSLHWPELLDEEALLADEPDATES